MGHKSKMILKHFFWCVSNIFLSLKRRKSDKRKILCSNEVFFRHWKGKPPVFRNLHHGPQPLRDGSESFPMNTQPVSHLHTQECQVSGFHKPPFALGQPSGIYSGLVTPPPGCSGMPAPSFQAQLLRHVWRIREDSKQLHRAGS